jgi:hypothetical protein
MPYTSQSRPHPRAGMAIGAAVMVGWLGAIGLATASDNSPHAETGAAPNAASVEGPLASQERFGPGEHDTSAD